MQDLPGPAIQAPEVVSDGRLDSGARARQALFAFLAYLVVSVLLFAVPILPRFTSVYVGAGRGDAKLYTWCLAWWPYAISHDLNPFLPKLVFAPEGVNMAWVTGLPGPAFTMWPVTALLGPVVASNVVSVLAPALNGWAAYLVCRRVSRAFAPALAGGYFFGFSTYVVGQLRGHMNLFLVFPVALAAYFVVRHAEGSLSDRRFVVLLALALVGEFSISTEVFASATFFTIVAAALVWWLAPDLRETVRRTGFRVILAYASAGAVLSPYLAYGVAGIPSGPLRPVASGGSSVDLLSYLFPRESTLIGGEAMRHLTSAFAPNLSEDGAYLSPAIVAVIWRAWRTRAREDRVMRYALIFAGVAGVAALGAFLHVDGHTVMPLPWLPFAHVPILQDALPQRFTMYAWLAVGVVVTRWLDGAPVRSLRWPLVASAAVLLLPNVAAPGLHGSAEVPAFISGGLFRQVLSPGETVVILDAEKGEEMLWQEASGFAFSMAQGHTGPEPASFRSEPGWAGIRDDQPQNVDSASLLAFLRVHGVGAVIVDRASAARWRFVLGAILHTTPVDIGTAQVYLPPPGQSHF